MFRNEETHFCYFCGGNLVQANENGYFREQCTNCGQIHYQHYKVGVAAIIFQNGKLLLLQRNQEPWKGYWNLPAGFLEIEETPEEGVIREVEEEAGLNVEVLGLRKLIRYTDDPRGNGFVLFYDCKILGGAFKENSEVSAYQYFSADDILEYIAGAGHRAMINALIEEGFKHD